MKTGAGFDEIQDVKRFDDMAEGTRFEGSKDCRGGFGKRKANVQESWMVKGVG